MASEHPNRVLPFYNGMKAAIYRTAWFRNRKDPPLATESVSRKEPVKDLNEKQTNNLPQVNLDDPLEIFSKKADARIKWIDKCTKLASLEHINLQSDFYHIITNKNFIANCSVIQERIIFFKLMRNCLKHLTQKQRQYLCSESFDLYIKFGKDWREEQQRSDSESAEESQSKSESKSESRDNIRLEKKAYRGEMLKSVSNHSSTTSDLTKSKTMSNTKTLVQSSSNSLRDDCRTSDKRSDKRSSERASSYRPRKSRKRDDSRKRRRPDSDSRKRRKNPISSTVTKERYDSRRKQRSDSRKKSRSPRRVKKKRI